MDDTEFPPDAIVEEASSLGWAPGQWPDRFEYDGKIFHRLATRWHNDEIVHREYIADGATLIVIND